jgi:hypothetical protein
VVQHDGQNLVLDPVQALEVRVHAAQDGKYHGGKIFPFARSSKDDRGRQSGAKGGKYGVALIVGDVEEKVFFRIGIFQLFQAPGKAEQQVVEGLICLEHAAGTVEEGAGVLMAGDFHS